RPRADAALSALELPEGLGSLEGRSRRARPADGAGTLRGLAPGGVRARARGGVRVPSDRAPARGGPVGPVPSMAGLARAGERPAAVRPLRAAVRARPRLGRTGEQRREGDVEEALEGRASHAGIAPAGAGPAEVDDVDGNALGGSMDTGAAPPPPAARRRRPGPRLAALDPLAVPDRDLPARLRFAAGHGRLDGLRRRGRPQDAARGSRRVEPMAADS